MSEHEFKSEVTFVARHDYENAGYTRHGEGSRYSGDNYGERKEWLTLAEAAARAGLSVEEVKRLIRDGELSAERRGWVRVHVGDLDGWRYRV